MKCLHDSTSWFDTVECHVCGLLMIVERCSACDQLLAEDGCEPWHRPLSAHETVALR